MFVCVYVCACVCMRKRERERMIYRAIISNILYNNTKSKIFDVID